jgi:Fe(3+) dicitrate transport protein
MSLNIAKGLFSAKSSYLPSSPNSPIFLGKRNSQSAPSALRPLSSLRALRALRALSLAAALFITPHAHAQSDTISLNSQTIHGKGHRLQHIPGSAHYLELQQSKSVQTDIHQILREIPGVDVKEEEGYGNRPHIGIRGTSIERNEKITVMEDGILAAPAPYSAPAAYYFPSVGRMQAIEVRKGSSQVPFGPSTTGGALNLISTQIPSSNSASITLNAGENQSFTTHAYAGGTTQNWGYLIQTHQQHTSGFKQFAQTDYHENILDKNTGFTRQDYLAKLKWRSPAAWKYYQELEFKMGQHFELGHETYLGLTEQDFAKNPYLRYPGSAADNIEVQQQQVSARWLMQFTPNLDISAVVYHTNARRNWYKLDKVDGNSISSIINDPDDFARSLATIKGQDSDSASMDVKANNRIYSTQGVQFNANWNVSTGPVQHSLQGGFRFHYDDEERYQWVDKYAMIDKEPSLQVQGTPGTTDNKIASATALALHLQDKMTLDRFSITPGIRFENIAYEVQNWGKEDPQRNDSPESTERDLQVVVWGLGTSFSVSDNHNIFAGVHRGFQPPGPGSNDSTKAEQSINMELGNRLQGSKVHLEQAVFANVYENLLGKETSAGGGAGTNELFNGGKALVAGYEVSAKTDVMQWVHSNPSRSLQLPLRGNYTFTHGEFKSDFTSNYKPWGTVESGDYLPYLAQHRFLVGAGVEYQNVALDVTGNYVGIMRHKAGKEAVDYSHNPGDYATINAQLNWQVMPALQVFTGGKEHLR